MTLTNCSATMSATPLLLSTSTDSHCAKLRRYTASPTTLCHENNLFATPLTPKCDGVLYLFRRGLTD